MARYYLIIASLCVAVSAAPPAPPQLYPQPAPAHLQNINTLEYFMDNPEIGNYYNQAQEKQRQPNGATHSRLETLEPDSEVELIPGAQQPQQPPQQTPVSPHLPGIAPGQRVFIVHMPVPGYRPGTIGGYQPVYIVAAAPQAGYAANGYQNAVLLNPAGQVINPYFGFPGAGVPQGHAQSGLLVGAPLPYNRPFEQVYQNPAFAYQPAPAPDNTKGPLQFSQLVSLQGQQQPQAEKSESISEPKQASEANSDETKDNIEYRRNSKASSPRAQTRQKA